MTLPASGQISLNQIHVEAGGSTGSQVKVIDTDVKAIIGANNSNTAFSDYYGANASQPSVSYKGRQFTESNGFPTYQPVAISLSSGSKVVVVCLQLGGSGNTFVNLNGSAMTLAAKVDTATPVNGIVGFAYTSAIYYQTTTATGTASITGNGGTGRSNLTVYEITGASSNTPYTTDTAQQTNLDLSASVTVASQYNGLTIGSVITEDSFSATGISISNADSVEQFHMESASAHCSWFDAATPIGNRTYTITQTPGANVNSGSTLFQITTASWK